MNRFATLLLALALAAGAAPAWSQTTSWYAGISAGESLTSDDLVANRQSTVTLASDFRTDFDDRDLAFRVTAGYRVFSWLAVEVDYTDLGSHRVVSDFMGGDPPAPARITLDRSITGYGADAVLQWPLAPRWNVFGRVGAFHARLDARQALDGNVVFTNGDPSERERRTTQSETVLRYGAGVQWDLTHCSWLRLEWIRHDDIGKAFRVGGSGTTGEAATDAILVGYFYRF